MSKLLKYSVAFLLIGGFLCVCLDVITRALGKTLFGGYEFITFIMSFMFSVALFASFRENLHLKVDVISVFVKGKKANLIVDILNNIITMLILVFLSWGMLEKAKGSFAVGETTPTVSLPLYPLYLMLSISSLGCAFLCFIYIAKNLKRLTSLFKRKLILVLNVGEEKL